MNCNRYPCESRRRRKDCASSPSRSRSEPVPWKPMAAELASSSAESGWSLARENPSHFREASARALRPDWVAGGASVILHVPRCCPLG